MEHSFTSTIEQILKKNFGKHSEDIFSNSQLIQYINHKTRSADKGSKSRSSFANLYAVYVIVEDYILNNYHINKGYEDSEGSLYSNLFSRQRMLPFGSSLQNHALNNRMNSEFQKFFPNSEYVPIIRNLETKRYWINENLLKFKIGDNTYNLSESIIQIIDEYIKTKQNSFQRFIETIQQLQKIEKTDPEKVEEFVLGLLAPNVDARLFEIVSYSILKYFYHDQEIIWGFEMEKLNKEKLKLFKTGRTNANDGGIDFVMRPIGRFFQVTETLDFKKYFLDIDKIQKYPISFIIKSIEEKTTIIDKIRTNASKIYPVKAIIDKYMECVEEIINIPILKTRFREVIKNGYLEEMLNEIIIQSKVEFNYNEIE